MHHDPFPHVIVENAFHPDLIEQAAHEWPDPAWPHWLRYDTVLERKSVCNDWRLFPATVRRLLGELMLLPVWQWLELPRSVPDSLLYGGGMAIMHGGDHLDPHLDHDRHALTGLERACNAVLFVGDWQEGWGGELRLWDHHLTRPVVQIEPRPGRLVVFSTSDRSYHSVAPLNSLPGVCRKSLATYWYTYPLGQGKRQRAQFVATADESPCPLKEALRQARAA